MKSYNSMLEAIEGLKKKGYTEDLNLKNDFLSGRDDLKLHPQDFEIVEVYRFEGMSNPDDNSVVYAIEAKNGIKGVLVDAYSMYAEAVSPGMAKRLQTNHRPQDQ